MYKYLEDVLNRLELFEESMPFGDQLDHQNRWIRLASLIDWKGLELIYAKEFSSIGRPALFARLVIGALIIKHVLTISDEELTQQIVENPYLQYFIGLKGFQIKPPFNSSTLTHVRKRLGEKVFDEFENNVIGTLVEKKLIKPRSLQTDATVYESEITYPTDTGLLNKARQYCVGQIKNLSKVVGIKVRTYCRVAQKSYVSFSKKRRKVHKDIRRMKKRLLQYLRRNIAQLSDLIAQAEEKGYEIQEKVIETFETVKKLYHQQKQMYKERKKSIESRIVSLHKAYIRPIVRNKSGKKVEFGAKVELSLVDGYLFADHISFDNFNESTCFIDSVEKFRQRFGKYPDYATMDQIYGTRKNRRYLKEHDIKAAVKPLGRPKKEKEHSEKERRWRQKKQRERNQIEGFIGYGKNKFSLRLVRAKLPETERSWIRMGLMSQNLITATKRM